MMVVRAFAPYEMLKRSGNLGWRAHPLISYYTPCVINIDAAHAPSLLLLAARLACVIASRSDFVAASCV